MTSPHSFVLPKALLACICTVWIATGVSPPAGHLDWFLENCPAMIAAVILLFTAKSFTPSRWVYGWLFVHALILAYGGFYTYAEAPLGFWFRDMFYPGRNHYDRLGHLAQGFIPAFVIREILLRRTPLAKPFSIFFLTTCVALALGAGYELLEGLTAHFVSDDAGQAFLGTQGDVWDTQWDMFCALVGSIAAQALFRRFHDGSMAKLASFSKEASAGEARA